MTEISAINYSVLTNTKAANSSSNKTDLTDGLSVTEMKKLDTNGDGLVTEAEFKKGFNGDESSKYWDTYTSFYKVSSKNNKVTQKLDDGSTVESQIDSKGKLQSYTLSNPSKTGVSQKNIMLTEH